MPQKATKPVISLSEETPAHTATARVDGRRFAEISKQELVDYVSSFYNPKDGIYPIKGLEIEHIFDAFYIYEDRCLKGDLEYVHYSWGGGDSLDRERVRDIILEQPQFTWSS
jgi:hypothetical protein